MNNQTDISLTFSNKITNEDKVRKYAEYLEKINNLLSSLNGNSTQGLNVANGVAKSFVEKQKDINKTSSALKTALSVSKIAAFTITTEKLIKSFSKMSEQSAAYLENMNLLDVAYNNNTNSADRLVNRMAEMYGLDESWGYRTVGMFKQLANAMDITGETGTKMANVLSLLAVDLSSLYNVSTTKSVEKLESALAGQTKPIRSYGADITEMTLQQTLLNNSIDMTVDKLSFAEKRLLIVSAILQQTKEANNDWARTIESLANQMRIFDEQVSRLTRSLGNIFLPILKTILPYVNAFLMVLVEITSWLAALVGYDPKEFDFFGDADANIMDVSSSVGDLGDSLDNASSSAKKLKQGLRGFDKLNNITTPTTGGGASGGGASGGGVGIDPKILDLFNKTSNDYLSKLTDVKMRATEIRDSIMEWLGFEKEINPLTGDVSFRYKGIKTTLSNMFKTFKNMSPIAKLVTGYIAYLTGAKIILGASKLIKLFGTTGLFMSIKKLATPLISLIEYTKVYKSLTGSLVKGISGASTSIAQHTTKWQKFGTVLVGAGGVIVGLQLTKNAMKDVEKEGWNLGNSLQNVGGIATSTLSGAVAGSVFGPWGLAIGAVIGAVTSLTTAFMNMPTEISKVDSSIRTNLDTINEYSDNINKTYDDINKQAEGVVALTTVHSNLVKELENIVDANGKIKEGYEERAKFIVTTLNNAYGTEISISNNKIENYKKEISYIKDIIKNKRAQLLLESQEEAYKVAIKEKMTAYQNLKDAEEQETKAKENQRKAEKEYQEQLKRFKEVGTANLLPLMKAKKQYKETTETLEKASKTVTNAKNTYKNNVDAIGKYEGLFSGITQENAKKIDYYSQQIESSYKKEGKTYVATQEEKQNAALLYFSTMLQSAKDYGTKIDDEYMAQASSELNALKLNLTNQKLYVKGVTPELAEAWSSLANTSEEKFLEEFKKLSPDLQQQVVDKMQAKGEKISSELQKGITTVNQDIKFNAKTTEFENKISSISSKIKSLATNALKNMLGITSGGSGGRADGGLFVNGQWKPIQQYAVGGTPPVGQMFIARERGPELVGKINNHTAVMNNDQIVSSVASGVYQAVRSAVGTSNSGTQVFNIYLDENNKIATYTLEQLQDKARDLGKPITITG